MAASGDDWADRFLSAALEPSRWDEALRAMAQATGSAHGQLIGFGPGASAFNWITDIDDSVINRTAQIDIATPDLNFRVAAGLQTVGTPIVHEAHYDMARQSLRADDYLDICSEFDIFDGCQTPLLMKEDMLIGLALLRERKDGRTSQDQRDLFALMSGHARNAVRLQRAIEEQGFALLAGTFEVMDKACWLVDSTGRIGGMTPRADVLLSADALRVADGALASRRPDESRRILHAVRAITGARAMVGDPVAITDDQGQAALILEFFPLPAKAWSLPFAPRGLIVARDIGTTSRQVDSLRRAFRLTPAEADVAIRLAAGMTRPDIALARGVSMETLKAQLRSIYEKTGSNRESQLVRLVGLLGG